MTGINQSFILTGTKGITARVTVQETYDIFANTSDVRVGVEIASGLYAGHIYYLLGSIAAEGQTLQSMSAYAGTHFVYLEKTGTYYPIAAGSSKHTGSPWNLTGIRHENDGSKTLTIDLRLTGEEEKGSGADDWEVYETIEVMLTRIPRASTIAATDARVGGVSVVAVSRKDRQYTHSIAYRFGELSGYLTEDGTSEKEEKLQTTGFAFHIPAHFYSQIPHSQSAICSLHCTTYRGDTQIGQAQSCSFTVSAHREDCIPLVSGSVTDGNPATARLTGNPDVLVRYMSDAVCTITATPRHYGEILEKQVDSQVITGDFCTIEGAEKETFTFSARDSRGYTGEMTVKKQMIPYVHLTCLPQVKRTDPTSGGAVLTVTGECFCGSFGAAENALRLYYRIGDGSWQEITAQPEDNKYTAQTQLEDLSYTTGYQLEVRAEDKLQSVTKTITLGKGIPVFDWGENDFAFHVPVRLAGMPQGEHDAVSKAYADQKTSVVKLWQNPDTAADFPAQTVEVDLTGFRFVFCLSLVKAGTAEYQPSGLIANQTGNAGHLHSIHCDGKDFWLNWRKFTLTYNGIHFDKAWMRDLTNPVVYEDWLARSVPAAIYGVK